ncbi:MAG TPA: hypothetical protein VHN79_14515 [Lacunisphaera sp.]|nr:hypothetical protein [Lacunisphaera sp.]
MITTKNFRPALLLVLGSTLCVSPVLRAGDSDKIPGGERRERLGENAGRLAGALGLTEDQKVRMQAIGEQEKAELEALRARAAGDKEALKAQAKEIRQKYREQRQAILTPEQRTKAETARKKGDRRRDRMERREERREKIGA